MPTSTGLRAALAGGLALLTLVSGPTAHAQDAALGGDALAGRGIIVPVGAPALPPTLASSWLVADLDTGEILATRDPHGRFAPASTLKTLTALTLIPRLDPHRVTAPTFADVAVDGSRVGLVEHVGYYVSQLFTAMLVVSGNDAANTLASANGGVARTVAQMNEQAVHLQALDTRVRNPSGLDSLGQTSSAYDLALIARAGMQLPAFRSYVAVKHSSIRGTKGPAIPIGSHDKLLYNYPGALGIKNGYTVAAKATFVGAAERGGHRLVVTLMHTAPRYWPEAAALLDWGFAAQSRGVAPVGRLVDPLGTPGPPTALPAAPAVPVAAAGPLTPLRGGLPGGPALPAAGLLAATGATALVVRRRRRA